MIDFCNLNGGIRSYYLHYADFFFFIIILREFSPFSYYKHQKKKHLYEVCSSIQGCMPKLVKCQYIVFPGIL